MNTISVAANGVERDGYGKRADDGYSLHRSAMASKLEYLLATHGDKGAGDYPSEQEGARI